MVESGMWRACGGLNVEPRTLNVERRRGEVTRFNVDAQGLVLALDVEGGDSGKGAFNVQLSTLNVQRKKERSIRERVRRGVTSTFDVRRSTFDV